VTVKLIATLSRDRAVDCRRCAVEYGALRARGDRGGQDIARLRRSCYNLSFTFRRWAFTGKPSGAKPFLELPVLLRLVLV